MKQVDSSNRKLALAVSLALASWQVGAMAQDRDHVDDQGVVQPPSIDVTPSDEAIEEVVVTGRFISGAQEVVNERINDSVVTDLLSADVISRLGDSTVGAALRRVPGISLVQDKFVYIRGLGERYSSSSLNGAQIPSPDLTRNVIPLDVFPTSIVESLRVQKAWSADLPAGFGGGAVDIRTRGIPDAYTFKLEFGGGYNTLNTGDGLTYPGGGDDWLGTDDGTRALSPVIVQALNEGQGRVNVDTIFSTLKRQDANATFAEAQALNRQLGLELNRNIGVESKRLPLDARIRGSVGNNHLLGNDWELGWSVGASYQTDWRKTTRKAINFSFPDERTDTEVETTRSVNVAGTINLGVKWLEDHEISTTTLWLRNTDDETATSDFFNENREIPDGLGFRNYRLEFEERLLLTNQIAGTHFLGEETRDRFPFLRGLPEIVPADTQIEWFYSDSEATTDIPNRVVVRSQTLTDPATAYVLGEQVALSNQAAEHRFLDLDDDVENYGWSFSLPVGTQRHELTFRGGYNHARKARTYSQTDLSLGPTAVAEQSTLQGPLNEVFNDANVVNPANNYGFDRQGAKNESYIAATMTDGIFGTFDWTYDQTWRIAGGARREDYRQAAVNWNPFGFTLDDPQITTDPAALEEGTFADDRIYPSAAINYMTDWWAETFQLRLGFSETTVRPDLREITGAGYIDPITGDLTRGNPGVRPAEVTSYDLRAEWFFGNGDNFTVTLFRKDIDKPIEFFESTASDTTVAREILNATDAFVQGVEIEGLKELGFLGGFLDTLFVSGNVTIQESELNCFRELDAGGLPTADSCEADNPTNRTRSLAGASDYVANVMLGFDSPEARHTASLIYNVFSERLYSSGRNAAPDSFEQPFHSLDFTYFWYPTDTLTLKLKAQNLLDEAVTIERGDVRIFEEEPGQTFGLTLTWAL